MSNKITDIVKEASDAVKHVPKHLQETAFNKVFDALMKEQSGVGHSGVDRFTQKGKQSTKKEKARAQSSTVNISLDKLNRTAHPDIHHNNSVLNNSLRLLKAAKDELNLDGITATSISQVLTEKFRCKLTRQAVSLALNGAGRHVNRHTEGKKVIFRIMGPGEDYLDKNADTEQPMGRKNQVKKKSRKTPTKEHRQTSKNLIKKKNAKKQKNKKGNRKVGSFAALTQIYEKGFFSKPRTVSDIIKHLKNKYGRTFKSNEFSPKLLKYIRDDQLTRERNSDNQYEYKQA